MKKSKKILAYSAALAASVGLTGCTMDRMNELFNVFQPDINVLEDVYGPPAFFEEEEEQWPDIPEEPGTDEEYETELMEEVETTEFDPMDNLIAAVYGPPEMIYGYDYEGQPTELIPMDPDDQVDEGAPADEDTP